MTTTHQHAITATLGLAAILALVGSAIHGQSGTALAVSCVAQEGCETAPTETRGTHARSEAAPARRAARVHLTMPYFSYARALPRTTEL